MARTDSSTDPRASATLEATKPPGNGDGNSGDDSVSFSAEHALNTILSTIPAAAIYLTDKDLQKGVGNIAPGIPALVAVAESFTRDSDASVGDGIEKSAKKVNGAQRIGDLIIGFLPLLLAKGFK